MKIKAAGFDPASFRNLGWAVMEIHSTKSGGTTASCAADTFVIDINEDPWRCLWPIFSIVDRFIDEYDPDLMIIEKTSSFAGGFVTGQVSNCIGAILACCGKHEIPVEFVYPTHVKKVVTGTGKASKTQIRDSVQQHLNKLNCETYRFGSSHAYDAISNILCWMIENPQIDYRGQHA